jgi:hypothetical protein
MNSKTYRFQLLPCIAIGAAMAFTVSDALAQTASVAAGGAKAATVYGGNTSVVMTSDDDDGDSHTIQIRVNNGKLTVVRDGKEVPASQIKQDDGQIVVTDKDGNEIQSFKVVVKGSPGESDVFFGNGEGWNAVAPAAAAPKVMLGVHMTTPGPALEHQLGLDPDSTTMINGLYEGLPAEQAGIEQYDIITKVNGEAPADNDAIRKALAKLNPGDTITFNVIHEGKPKTVTVKVQAYDADAMKKAKLIGEAEENQIWSIVGAPTPHGESWLGAGNLSELYHGALVAPNGELHKYLEEVKPQLNQLKQWHAEAMPKLRENVDEQLERLDKRMSDLEDLLEKLIEKQTKDR